MLGSFNALIESKLLVHFTFRVVRRGAKGGSTGEIGTGAFGSSEAVVVEA
jgi:hypothetical protein